MLPPLTEEAWQCLVVVMVLVMAAELTTMAAIATPSLLQLRPRKHIPQARPAWPQRHGRALLAFSAPPCNFACRTEYNLGSCDLKPPSAYDPVTMYDQIWS